MNEIVYQALIKYYHALECTGYMAASQGEKLLVLAFYNEFVMNDYRGLITKDDYRLIERALNCLYGSSCLIPYPDYLKMGKLHIGEMSEMAQRVKTLEDTDVVKTTTIGGPESDVLIVVEE